MKRIENLSFSYGENKIFSSFNAEFEDTGLYIITGSSGIGKSTLLRIIAGLEKDFTGAVYGFENNIISVAFQNTRLLPWLSARENVAAVLSGSRRERLKKADEWLERLGLSDYKNKRPDNLSGGQQQRASLARALAAESTVILLDEPTTGLDTELSENVMEIIKKEAQNKLVVCVTHGEKERTYADRIISL